MINKITKTCFALTCTSLFLTQTSASAQYCNTLLGGDSTYAIINDFSITNTTLSNLNSSAYLNATFDAYTAFPATGNTTATINQGGMYVLNGRFDSLTSQGAVWIDFDHSGTFDPNEYYEFPTPSNATVSLTIIVPSASAVGTTGMRLRSRGPFRGGNFSPNDACAQFYSGETEDYTITIAAGVPCVGNPTAGTITALKNVTCTHTIDTINLVGSSFSFGITHQWQNSADAINWTNTSDTSLQGYDYGLHLGDSIYYRVMVSCATGGTVYSNVIKITTPKTTYECYCKDDLSLGNACFGPLVNNVTIIGTTLNNSSGCANGFNFYFPTTPNTTTDSLLQAFTYTVSVNTTNADNGAVWLDSDHSGGFDANEYYPLKFIGDSATAQLLISSTALTGKTGMRVRAASTSNIPLTPNDACGSLFGSETEDYIVNIQPGIPCTGSVLGGIINVTDTVLCVGTNLTLNVSNTTPAVGIISVWQMSVDGVNNWTTTLDSGLTITLSTPPDSMYYRLASACGINGTQAYSTIAKIKALPAYACYCASTLDQGCGAPINNVTLVGTTLNNSTSCNTGYDVFYPTVANTTANLAQALIYTLEVGTIKNHEAAAWIDFDHSGTFDGNEFFTLASNGTLQTGTIIIPQNATLGFTGMRVRASGSYPSGLTPNNACGSVYAGEVEDYVVNIIAGTPCIGTPIAGVLTVNDSSLCANEIAILNLSGQTLALNIATVWQSSTNGSAWANTGDSSITITDYAPTDSILYRVAVSCANGAPVYTNVVTLKSAPNFECYCHTNIGGDCFNSNINNVAITGTTLHNANNNCYISGVNDAYTRFPETDSTTAVLGQGFSYSIDGAFEQNVQQAGCWIDFDHNGIYDAYEFTPWALPASSVSSINVTIPNTALLGKTGMRVRSLGLTFSNPLTPCNPESSGETEDYIITIVDSLTITNSATINNKINATVYPNPTNDVVTIKTNAQGNATSVCLYNNLGQLLQTLAIKANGVTNINVANYANGIYLLKIMSDNFIEVKPLIIQH
jgi:GEVED domain/Secretion system C-terminal sorting domain